MRYEKPKHPVNPVGQHYTQVDLSRLMAQKLYQLQEEIDEIGCEIPATTLLVIESCGYQVDLSTGVVTE